MVEMKKTTFEPICIVFENMKQAPFIFLSLIALAGCTSAPPPPPRAIAVKVTKPTIQDTPIFKEYPGHIEALKTVNIQSQVAGTLTGMYFEEGTTVKQGQLLFTIDARPYIAALNKAEAALARSIAALKYSEETVQRYTDLVKENFVAKLDYDQYIATALEDDATVKENLAEIETAKINLGYCSLYAPMDAVAGKKNIDVGNYIEVGENTPLIVLNQINPVQAAFYVPDIDLPKIQAFQKKQGPLAVEVYFEEGNPSLYKGNLTLIDNGVDQSTGAIFMKATLPNENQELWPGEFVTVKVIFDIEKEALLVPSEALQLGQKGYYAYVVKEDTAELRYVEISARLGNYTHIQSGLSKGDTIVLEGQLNLYPGAKVHILPSEEKKP